MKIKNHKKFIAKGLLSILVIAGTILAPMPMASKAQAATTAELQAQIQSLLQSIAALQAQIGAIPTNAPACSTIPQPLTIGSRGVGVTALQVYLTSTGHFNYSGGATGYFGEITRQALASWQAANGIAPAAGYWGPISLAKYNTLCLPAQVPSTPGSNSGNSGNGSGSNSGSTKGDEGSMTVIRGSANSSVLDLGDTEDIYSVKIEAEDSDMEINRIDFVFNKRPWLYISELEISVDGDKLASMRLSSSKATELGGNEWRVRFTNVDLEIEEGDEVEVILWATTPDSLPGDRSDDSVSVYMPDDGVRGVDGAGLIHYEPSGDLSSRSFSFDENFGLGEIEVRENDDSPEEGIIVVSNTKKTDNVSVMKFDVEAEDGDVTIEEIYVTATTSTPDKPDDVVSQICLFVGSTKLDCGTFAKATSAISNRGQSTGVDSGEYYVLFDDLDLDLDEDDEEEFELKASINKVSSSTFSSGETITFSLEQVAGFNEDFENTSDSALGIGSDEIFTLLTEGVFVGSNTTSVSEQVDPGAKGGSDQYRTYTLKFEITAVEEDAYIFNSAGTSSTSGVQFNIKKDGADVSGSFTGTVTATLSSNASKQTNSWKVSKGQTKQFTLSVLLDPDTAGFYAVELDKVEFFGSDSATESDYTEIRFPDRSEFETDPAFIDNAA